MSHLVTTSRTATWRIISPHTGLITSEEFVIGKWTWYLKVQPQSEVSIMLTAKRKNSEIYNLPSPTVSLGKTYVSCSKGGPEANLLLKEVIDMKFGYDAGVYWDIRKLLIHEAPITVRVEFLDLKMPLGNGNDVKLYSIWSGGSEEKKSSNKTALSSIGRMLSEKIQLDVIINTSNGSIGAHRAILAANSPVFQAMFSNKYKEEVSSTIDISDMSLETCEAMLKFIYGTIDDEKFIAHRMELASVADKYDMVELKRACEFNLVEDTDTKNVLDRLQFAFLYKMHELKSFCLRYLVNLGTIHDIRSEMDTFFQDADKELIAEIVSAILDSGKYT